MSGPDAELDTGQFDTNQFDTATDHYRVLATDPSARAKMIAEPKQGLRDHFGYVAEGDYDIEVVAENTDVITLLLPAPPAAGEDIDHRLAEVRGRIFDILFSEGGVGGYLVPSEALTWVLRDMRANWTGEQ
ncbi:MAG: hypothetical protein AB7G47_15400 [Mycolicibacterium sp.]|uniref:hypothetical protein n=1 Tax=Mycolicibacterium sp. TaxID=2320850 RepID=UPI003D0ECCA0